jgi:hypothetical protein
MKSETPGQVAERKPLEILRDTERSLRQKTVGTLAPVLPEKLATNLGEASVVADESLEKLAAIDLEEISDGEMRPARIRMGLLFVGFGALMMVFLLLYLDASHPELSTVEQVRHHWYQYIWFVSIGVAGMFMLGREAMRPPVNFDE